MPIISALGAVLGAGTAFANYFVNRANLEDARAYNSPAAQMYRLKQAGINPYSQAAQGNIDSTFGQMQESDFGDVSDSYNAAVDNYNQREATKIKRQLAEGEISLMAERVRGLELDNQYKQASLDDRLVFVWQKTALANLDWQIKQGIITRQDADNRVAQINAQVQEYLAGSTTFMGKDVTVDDDGYTGIPALDKPLSDLSRTKGQAAHIHEQLKYLLDTHEDRVKFARYHSWREFYAKEYERRSLDDRVELTQHQAQYWLERSLREEIAREYEDTTGMPFMNKDVKSHVIMSLIHAIGKAYNAGNAGDKFDARLALREFFREMTSADVDFSSRNSLKNVKNWSGAGGSY